MRLGVPPVPARPRVAVVGFQKTGTTALQLALEYLGYDVAPVTWPAMRAVRDGDDETVRSIAARYDAVQDMPWFLVYRELDEWFPGTRFVLTVRDEDGWMASWRRHFEQPGLIEKFEITRRLVFGDVALPSVDETPYRDRYREHNEEVQRYFADRPHDLLVLRLGEGGEWERLCAHLGLPVPRRRGGSPPPFPRVNVAAERESGARRARIRRLRRARRVVNRVLGARVAGAVADVRRRVRVRRTVRRAR